MVSTVDVPVSESVESSVSGGSRPPRHPLVRALSVVLAIESIALAGVAVVLVVETITAPTASLASAIALAAIAVIAAVWVGVMARSVLVGRAWVRGATVVVEVLTAALAIAAFQAGSPGIGVLLAVPAAVGLVLVFSPPVVGALGDRSPRD
jgi:hypothetical protein